MRVITTFNQRLYKEYAWRLVETFKNFPGELIVYSEDKLDIPFEVRDLYACCPELKKFKDKMQNFRPRDWRFDVVKFSNKVFATVHGLSDWEGTGIWLDADNVIFKPVPEKFIEDLVPKDKYCGHFDRYNSSCPYTETGFLMFRCGHADHKPFMQAWQEQFTKGLIFRSQIGWHDCIAFDVERKRFKSFVNLTPRTPTDLMNKLHPIAQAPLGEYIDHCKGNRKVSGYSKENPSHWWEGQSLTRPSVLGDATRPNNYHEEGTPPS